MKRIVAASLILAGGVFGCGRSQDGTAGSASPAVLTIAVIPKGQVHVFWQTVRAGAEAAGREAGVAIVWSAPQVETDFSGQASIVEDFVNRKVAAIVLAPSHSPFVQRMAIGAMIVIVVAMDRARQGKEW